MLLNLRTGQEMDDQSLRRLWQRTHLQAKFGCRNQYQMRHTFASNLQSQRESPSDMPNGSATIRDGDARCSRWVAQDPAPGFDRPPARYGRACLPDLPAIEGAEKRV